MVTEQYLLACIYHGYRGDWRTECISDLPGILLEDLYAPDSVDIFKTADFGRGFYHVTMDNARS